MHLLPKIHKRLDNIPFRQVISNCETTILSCKGNRKYVSLYSYHWGFFKHPHHKHLKALRKQLDAFYNKCILTDDLMKMAELVLKNKYFEFSSTIKHKISQTAIGTKCTPLYACIFMNYIETEFLKSEYI